MKQLHAFRHFVGITIPATALGLFVVLAASAQAADPATNNVVLPAGSTATGSTEPETPGVAASSVPNADAAGTNQLKPHWSHLPIWGVEAEARGHQIPLPFGIGVTYYRENQPFKITDLQVSRGGTPVSVNDFLQLHQVDTTQSSALFRADTWLFPFLNIYAVGGYTSGNMEGEISLPPIPSLGIRGQILPLNIGYEGPTYGGGITLAGGFKLSEASGLTLFAVADGNYTVTDLDFTDEKLFTNTKANAWVFSSRVGLRGRVSQNVHLAFWTGAMFQSVSEFLVGRASDQSFAFMVVQDPVAPWNALLGTRLEIGRHFDIMVEGGVGTRHSIMGGLTCRF